MLFTKTNMWDTSYKKDIHMTNSTELLALYSLTTP